MTENRCGSCRHWQADQDDVYSLVTLGDKEAETRQVDFDEENRYYDHPEELQEVRFCRSPRVLFYRRPGAREVAVWDGSGYRGSLVTHREFGCVNWEASLPPGS